MWRRWSIPVCAVGSSGYFSTDRKHKPVCDSNGLYQPLRKVPSSAVENDVNASMRTRMQAMILRTQNQICEEIEALDGQKFQCDDWERKHKGGVGKSRVLQNGNVFEKAGVNVSIVQGIMTPKAVQHMKSRGKELLIGKELPYFACGLSVVMHPHNPMAPTVHMNYRYFEVDSGNVDENGKPVWLAWFGGGSDLTPAYLFESDATHFHKVYQTILDDYDTSLYPTMKKTCDDYFYIPHRQESRGVGGIFFDDMEQNLEQGFSIAQRCAHGILDAYVPILKRRINLPFTKEQKEWQQLRRGRYVEFNLMYDRGTKFGLATPGARIESILMSLPLTCRYEYMNEPAPTSWEGKTLDVLRTPRDWVSGNTPKSLKQVSTSQLFEELAKRSETKP